MAKLDPSVLAHLEWIGFVRPTGLVVSAPALTRAGAILDRSDVHGQRLLVSCVEERVFDPDEGPVDFIPDFFAFAREVLGWSFSPKGYVGMDGAVIPSELEVPLPDYGETLRPDLAVKERDPSDDAPEWQLLVTLLDAGESFDDVNVKHGFLEASPHGRMERLLRETRVPAGLLFNGRTLRVISAPRGESSGWIDFKVTDMLQTAGRPISSAMRLLLSEQRLLALPSGQRLAALLRDSRKFQNEVSERLAEQVLHALYELLRGFQAAHDRSGGKLLSVPLSDAPDLVYRALLTVILRLVFVLYAEERDMLPRDEAFLNSYSIAGLYDRLREDAALHPDTMDHRYGAWAQLLVLFRMMHDGAVSDEMKLPARHGSLFDPNRYPFLEGWRGNVQMHERTDPPLVPDGTVHRVLEDLLILDGERISYRALDVEQIGSVYETMMGFKLETATGQSIAIRPQKRYGAPVAIDLEETLAQPPTKRAKWIGDRVDRKLTAKVSAVVGKATSLDDLHAALMPVIDHAATPDLVPKGAMVLQPSEERRRSGSHYTPRSLTEPIVRSTLEPILARMRQEAKGVPKPEQILELKVCDPAKGSGAFLVETCRQLAEALVEAWRAHDEVPEIPPDEDEVIYARRLIAQRCLYGIDRNPVAVDLAKMSLWLATLARDHAFTFLDHAFRHGDSLVGLTRRQIEAFHWEGNAPIFAAGFEAIRMEKHLKRVTELRERIRVSDEELTDSELHDLWDQVEYELSKLSLFGDLVVAAFFDGKNAKEREKQRLAYARVVQEGTADEYRGWLHERRLEGDLVPFHWELEFPEVFHRDNPGFDAIVGNPPFLGGTNISERFGMAYFQWLTNNFHSTRHHCDLVAYFFRRAYACLGDSGCLGFIATNTIAQGDTREGGLRVILEEGGQIYEATRRLKWPGLAAVVVSVLHISKNHTKGQAILDGIQVDRVSAYLVKGTVDTSPSRLAENPYFSLGSKIYGQGFLFADGDPACTPISERDRILASHPDWENRMPPYLTGEEVNSDPLQKPRRYVIFLSDVSDESQLAAWPDLREIVEEKVKPERMGLGSNPNNVPLKKRWWAYQAHRPQLYSTIAPLERVLVISRVTSHVQFTFVPSQVVFSESIVVLPLDNYAAFCALQARPHETWARFFGSSMKDDLRYTPSDIFETFAFPEEWETRTTLEQAGKEYYDFRAELMVHNDQGLTKTYNRFHNPYENDTGIATLRDLHAAMDRAVLEAYGWADIATDCDFYLDYEVDEEELGNKKKPWRYRWPDDVRDEVLARLLTLNEERAAEERRSGADTAKGKAGNALSATQEERLFT